MASNVLQLQEVGDFGDENCLPPLNLVKGGLAHAMLPAELGHLAALLMLAQHRYNLRFRPFALSH